MNIDKFENYECDGQMSIDEWVADDIQGSLYGVADVFARARKKMNLTEAKAFIFAISHFDFLKDNPNKVLVDKKELAKVLGLTDDVKNLSQNLKRALSDMVAHSIIEFESEDIDYWEVGALLTRVTSYKNRVAFVFNPEYMGLFSNLQPRYLTMWSKDIFQMRSERSIKFYEYLRDKTYTEKGVNGNQFGIKALKEFFDIPKDGKGSYMRSEKNGGFDRTRFEKKVIDPLFEDLARCEMIRPVKLDNGKYYEKMKKNGRVIGYKFYWTFSAYPSVASAEEVKEINDAIEKNPQLLKVAKDILNGQKNPKKQNQFNQFPQREQSKEETADLEKILLQKSLGKSFDNSKPED